MVEAIRAAGPLTITPVINEEIGTTFVQQMVPGGPSVAENQLDDTFYSKEPPKTRPTLPEYINELEEASMHAISHGTKQLRAVLLIMGGIRSELSNEVNNRQGKASEVALWGMLADVVQYFTSAASLIAGGTLLTNGSLLSGGMLVIGGGSTIASLSLKNYGGDEKVTGLLAIIGAGFSLIGGAVSWGDIATQTPNGVMTLVHSALQIIGITTTIGTGYSKSSLTYIDRLIRECEHAIHINEQDARNIRETVKNKARQMSEISKQLTKMLRDLEESKRQILAGQ